MLCLSLFSLTAREMSCCRNVTRNRHDDNGYVTCVWNGWTCSRQPNGGGLTCFQARSLNCTQGLSTLREGNDSWKPPGRLIRRTNGTFRSSNSTMCTNPGTNTFEITAWISGSNLEPKINCTSLEQWKAKDFINTWRSPPHPLHVGF